MKIRVLNKIIKVRPYSFLFDVIWICRILIPAIFGAASFLTILWLLG